MSDSSGRLFSAVVLALLFAGVALFLVRSRRESSSAGDSASARGRSLAVGKSPRSYRLPVDKPRDLIPRRFDSNAERLGTFGFARRHPYLIKRGRNPKAPRSSEERVLRVQRPKEENETNPTRQFDL